MGWPRAHRLTELMTDFDLVVLEAGSRPGGVLETVHRDGFLIEHSADNFITNVPWAVDLCRRIGLGDALVPTAAAQRGRWWCIAAGWCGCRRVFCCWPRRGCGRW